MGSFLFALLGLSSLVSVDQAVNDAGGEHGMSSASISTSSSSDVDLEPVDDGEPSDDDDSTTEISNIQWAASYGFQCRTYRGRRVCDGPRRVPEPSGTAAELATKLGLGLRSTASSLMMESPRREWLEAVTGEPPSSFLWPVEGGELSRGFGYVRSGTRQRLHKGFDINAEEGTPIRAVADGLVAYSDNGMRGYGNLLIVIHADSRVTLSSHCRSIFVFAGQQVRAGQVVAEIGHTGNAMGPHLHFELRSEGRPVDPFTSFEEVFCRRPRFCKRLAEYHRQLARARSNTAHR